MDDHRWETSRRARHLAPHLKLTHVAGGDAGIEVGQAFDSRLRRDVAIKLACSPAAASAILREARLLARLEHPSIITVHELGQDADGCPYFTTPLAIGRSLASILSECEATPDLWPSQRLVQIAIRVGEALSHAHGNGLAHGRLDASRVLVGSFGEVLVTDWDASAEAAPRVDIAAMGRMLQNMFRARSPEIEAIARKAIAREPAARFPAMHELTSELRAYVEGRVVSAHVRGPLVELKKWVGRNRGLALALLAALLLSFTGLGLASAVSRRGNQQLTRAQLALASAEIQARAAEQLAQRTSEQVLGLADSKRLQRLITRAHELWPTESERISAYESWLREAAELMARLTSHRAHLAQVRARLQAGLQSASADVVATNQDFDGWLCDRLDELVRQLQEFGDPRVGELASVERRLAFAHVVDELSLTGTNARTAWAAASRSIADREQCPLYGSLVIRPQRGLLPVGRDPDSGLWEFVHLETGSQPIERDAQTGHIRFATGSGLVLVLLPGGTFVMGSQSSEPNLPSYDPGAWPNEGPVHHVTLEPFFCSKYEMSAAQWGRVTGAASASASPIENVSWEETMTILTRLGLALPTEAQWEYALRAGTTTPWFTGTERAAVVGTGRHEDPTGLAGPCAVDWYACNPFGLYGMTGNRAEWCRDSFAPYRVACLPGDGLRLDAGDTRRVLRGCDSFSTVVRARSAYRRSYPANYRHVFTGVRPIRVLER